MREYIDNLTGLYNLYYLKEHYNEYIDNKEECYLISIDFKKLKYINDNFGHASGDKSIITFANIAKDVFEKSLVVRRSGDEFVIVTDFSVEKIINCLQLIVQKINEAHKKGIIPINFEFNSGIKLCENDFKETLYKSDLTMYHAKNNDLLYTCYTHDLLFKVKNNKRFISKIDELIENNNLNYVIQTVYDIDGRKTNINQIYTRDNNNESIFKDGKLEILKKYYRIKRIDMKNMELLLKYVLPKSNNDAKYMINVYYDTIMSRECNFLNYMKKLKSETTFNFENLILNINITDYNDSLYKLIAVIIKLKETGLSICLDNLDFSKQDVIISLSSMITFEYVNVHRKSLIKAMNEKRYKIVLDRIINLLLDLGITPIFVNVEKPSEVKFIKEMSDKCLISGYIYGKEEQLKKG